jgi:hypothetical protein
VAGGLLPFGCCGSLYGVFGVWGKRGRVVVPVSCACVSFPLRPVLHAYCFHRQRVPPSCDLLGGLVAYVYCCSGRGFGECV